LGEALKGHSDNGNIEMDLQQINGFNLLGLSARNVILGKNGCGKSYLLKQIEQGLQGRSGFGKIRYISPERGGLLRYEAGIDQAISNDPVWMVNARRRNQSENFRQQSASLFRRLELLVLREIERDHTKPDYVPRTFDATLERLNKLLDRVKLERDAAKGFKVVDRTSNDEVESDQLSSGESELISLGIEFLAFVKECAGEVSNVLLVDEPDVHLHPDLQDRLARFIVDALNDQPVTLVLATHSTALLSAMAEKGETRVAFMRRSETALTFKTVSEVDRAILPIYGAHPLSNVFNEAPILLIEGEDDERIWQQTIRSAQGAIRVYPCVVDGVARFAEYEREVNNVIESVYDDAKGYSLRDRDLHPELINDLGHVLRMRLSCRAAENLLLTNEVLGELISWEALQTKIRLWAVVSQSHQYHADVAAFIAGGFDRKNYDLKSIRNILVGLISNKPWEVLVGQAIAHLARNGGYADEGSLRDYLGARVCQLILKLG
jgi:energy-coupling factor transporter ATP-binding protein EcfA2